MKKIIIPILLTLLPCHNLYAQSNEKKFSGYELGKLHVQKYDNYQCRLLRNFVQNTYSSYKIKYKKQKNIKRSFFLEKIAYILLFKKKKKVFNFTLYFCFHKLFFPV